MNRQTLMSGIFYVPTKDKAFAPWHGCNGLPKPTKSFRQRVADAAFLSARNRTECGNCLKFW